MAVFGYMSLLLEHKYPQGQEKGVLLVAAMAPAF
jgi:hypothetical protein